MVTVSVIIPNYNHSEYLKQRIDSVLNQTFSDFELILLDDCSTDNSASIINQYANHPKVSQIVINDLNSGSPFLQWKKGITLSKGKYIWIAESDDWCEPSFLAEMLEGMGKDESNVISYCQMACILGDNTIKWQSHHSKLSEVIDGNTFIKNYVALDVAIYNASIAIFKKETFNSISNFFTDFKFSGDRVFWIEMSRHGSVHISGKTLNYFRKHGLDVSTKAYKSGLNFIEELRIINWMYTENMIDDTIYDKAFRKQYKEYWLAKGYIDPLNKNKIKELFSSPLSKKTSTIKFLPTAVWGKLKSRRLS